MYKWQVFLGGAASATVLLAGAALPALARTTTGSPLSSVTQTLTGSQVTGDACNLAGIPMASQVNSAMAGLTGQSCTTSNTSNDPWESSSNAADSSTMTSALPGLSAVTGEIPGLSSMSSSLPVLGSSNGQNSQGSSPTSNPAGVLTTPMQGTSLNSLGSSQGSSVLPGSLNGITGQVGSLTGGLTNLGSVTSSLSGVTGQQQG